VGYSASNAPAGISSARAIARSESSVPIRTPLSIWLMNGFDSPQAAAS
jgi:hypothetical protein